jgi:hypothetical protein
MVPRPAHFESRSSLIIAAGLMLRCLARGAAPTAHDSDQFGVREAETWKRVGQ